LLPPAVIGFHDNYPNVELSILGLRTSDIYNKLLQNELDLGVVFLQKNLDELESIPLLKEDLAVPAPINHPNANESCVRHDILREVPALVLPHTYSIRQLPDQACQSLSLSPVRVMEMTKMK